MADQLCTPDDLATFLGLGTFSALPADKQARLTLLVEVGTAEVQAACGRIPQRLVEVEDDEIAEGDFMGTIDKWLQLPQRPVWAVSDVAIDGLAVTDWKRVGSRLWRLHGWARCAWEPSLITLIYSHGYRASVPAEAQRLLPARNGVLSICRTVWENPTGVTREQIDDYSWMADAAAAAMEAAPALRASLQRTYGLGAGGVRL